ncbi:hypothetical protein DH2020_018030 [Rehmannia glutinosa]|uniref:Cytochrome P450 n=1 Tax=Rehmannia glutinosa TaxID=99300 RepID=A0ABR0WHS9_REHGL
MAWSFALFPWLSALCALALFINFLSKLKNKSSKPLPPGPPGWPLVGNIFDLGEIPHQTFYKLQAQYGPVIMLKLGSINTMVVQSAEAASELFKKCDLPFADRKAPDSLTALGYNQGSVAIGVYSGYCRKVRRIGTTEFLVNKRVNASIPLRQKCIDDMIGWIKKDVAKSKENGGSGEIQLDWFLFVTSFNTVGNLMLSREVMDAKLDRASDFFDAFVVFLEWVGKPNVADFFPFLKWMDPQGIKRNTATYLERLLGFASEIVKERIEERELGKEKKTNDFLDALLDEGEVNEKGVDKLSLKNITIVLLATVKEILRLHPAIQMLLPRNAIEDTEFMGYFVPKNTQIFVNAWAIHRDPSVWPDPLAFKPERFLDSDIDFKGQHFDMIPFGSGRRSCLGLTLGHRMVCLSIASLLQTFDWKLPDGAKPEDMDMREMLGLTLRKKVPLKVIPILRE